MYDKTVITEEAIDAVRQALEWFGQGYTLEQISEWYGMPEIDGDKTVALRILVATVSHTGVLD